ncbi:MAG: hypothetical protein Q7S52_01375 [bacterium]|nr:hypothetical protein [bacterium]
MLGKDFLEKFPMWKRYLPVVVFILATLAVFLWHLWMGPSDEDPGYMEPTGQSEQSITRNA